MALRIEAVTEATQDAWRDIHNRIIPASPIAAEEMAERRRRHRLTLAYLGDQLVGNATIRPPADNSDIATVIVRILPEHRSQGLGASYLEHVLDQARALGAARIETVVLADSNAGLRFARKHGFREIDRYVVDGVEYADLALF